MYKLRSLIFCAGLIAPVLAHAGVIYQWRTASTSPSIHSVTGLIELTDSAAQSGHVSYDFTNPCLGQQGCDYQDSTSPIIRFSFKVNHYPIDINFHTGSGFIFGAHAGWFKAAFSVEGKSLGSMALYANDSQSHVLLDGTLIADANSDLLGCPDDGCNGATGAFFRIPEPGSIGRLAAGLLSLALLRRRRRM